MRSFPSRGALLALVSLTLTTAGPALAPQAAAQTILPPSGIDVIGLYAPDPDDPAAPFTPERVSIDAGAGEFEVWVFLTTVSFPTVAGFEFSLHAVDDDGNTVTDVQIVDAVYPTGGTNAASWPDFQVTLGGSLGGIPPYNVWLVRITFDVNTSARRYVRLCPLPSGPTIPDGLGYWDAVEPPNWRQMIPISPDPRSGPDYERAVFAFNDGDFVAAPRSSWSAVKELFR